MSAATLRIGVLASGAGTTLQAIVDACEVGTLAARVVCVITNNSGSGACRRAQTHGIRCAHLSAVIHPAPAELDAAIRDELLAHGVELVVLAGYMKKLGPATLAAFPGRVVNTHPALLPRHGGRGMYGQRVHAAVLAAGETTSGISVHVVDSDYDTGRVLARRTVPVLPDDDVAALAARVQAAERPFLVEVLRRIAGGEITLGDRQARAGPLP
jgi:phosphoribosylglycinamide formyltransferase 1